MGLLNYQHTSVSLVKPTVTKWLFETVSKQENVIFNKKQLMDIQTEKYALIEYITQIKDIRIIEKLR